MGMYVDAPPAWDEIAKSQEFQSLTPNEKANVQRRWMFYRMNYDYDRGNEINQKAMVKEFKKNGFEPTVINTGFKDFTDYRSYMEGQQAEGLQGDAREEALSPNYSFGEGLLVGSQQAAGALGAGLVRPFEGMAGLADMTVGKALETVTGSRMGIDKLANNLHGIVADMGRGVETDVIHGFSEGGFWGGVNALTNMVLMEAPNQIIQLGIGAAGIPQPYALAMLGASSMGSEYNELKNDKSLSELQKYSIATLNGTIEGVTELMDSIPFIKRMTSSTKQAIFREFMRSKPIRTMAKEFLKTFAGEAAEEATGEFLQNVSEAAIRGEKINWKDLGIQVANAGIGGGAMGGMMGVGGVAYNRHADRNRTSRKAFQEIRALQMGFNPQAKNFNKLVDKIQLPDKFTPLEARRKAIDDYDFHGEPISFGEEVTDAERVNALKERIAWYDNIKDYIEDGKEKAEWDEYYKEWTEKLDALQNKKADNQPEQLPPPVDEEGNELGAEEVTEEEPPKEEKPAVVEKPAEEKPKEPPRWVAEHPNHEKSPGGHYEIVDANDILVSGDEGHLAIMQNRSEGTERTAQINDMSAHPNVSKMFTEGLTDEGAPIAVMRDGKLMVVSGNGRTKARRLMATRRTDMEYLNKLQQWAKDNGVEMPKGMQAPMLLRVIDENLDDEQLKDFVRQANMEGNDKLALDAAERSADDAVGMEKHGDKLIGLFIESEGDAIVSASNKEFLSKFRSLIGKRDGDVDFNGLPTSQFERRVANAFLGMLFKNMPVAERNDLLNNFINHGDKYNIVGVYRGLAKKAPKLIKLAQSNKAFALDDILPKALDALLDFKANREQFKNDPDMYLNQPMFGGMDKHELKGDERDLFKILATAKYQSQMARVLQDYVDKARLNATPDLYGETMNRGQLLQSVLAAEQARVESNGGAAVDAFLDNGSFDDSDMPTVEGERRVSDTPKKAAKRNPMLRGSVENETQAAKTDAEDSFVEQISKAAKDVADGFGYKVVVHKNDADLPLSVQEDLAAFGDGTFAEAWMDNEGVVHLVASRLESSEDAIKKVLHEIVGHIGLAALFKEGRYSDAWFKMTEDLWEAHREDIKKRCAAYVNAEGFDVDSESGRANLVEEWLARLAETNRKPLWWKSIVSKVRALLRSVGLDVAWSDSDIQQLLADAATAARQKDGKVKTGNRFSVGKTKPVQDETSPIPQGPLPPIANIMRQRTARSPISNLRALRLPAIVMLGRKLGGSLSAVDRIKRMPSALGVFREGTREIEFIRSLVEPHQLGDQWVVPQGKEDQKAEMIKDYWAERDIPRDEIEIVMKTDEAAKEVTIKAIWHDKSQTLFKKVLGHEIGHLIDYNQGETTTHGNVLGTVGGMGYKYLRKIIGETPDNQIDFEKFEKRKKKLHKQAEGLAGEKPKDADELKAWRETVKAEYANLLTSECEQNGWFQAAVIRDELIANTEWWSGEIGLDPNYRRYRTSPTELFAEAMSVLLNAPDKFAKQLPETWRMLQNYQKERPEFHKAWQRLMRMMNNEEAYTDALMKLAEEGFTADEETEIQIEKEHHNAWRAIKRKIVDSFADVNDASKQLVREGKVTLDETPISNIVSATHQSIKDYYLILAERLSKPLFAAGLTESDIGKYLEFQRIVNDPSINQGHIINPNGMTVNDAKDALAKLKRTLGKEKWELLGKWHKDFWQLRQETIIRLAEESGMYDKALIEHMKKNEWYSYRAVVEQIYNADGTEKRGMSKIYGLKGTLSPIANPLGWTYDHDMRLMGGILWNQAKLKTIQFMKEQFPDLVNKVKKFGVVSKNAPDGFTRLAVLENGQYVEYDIAETWAKGFQSQLDRDTAAILEKAQWITNLYRRAWTTLSPTFLLNNVVRDYFASYQNLSGINRQIGMVEWTKCWMQGMKEAFKFQFKGESELIEGMMKSNMFQSGGKGYDMSGRSGELAGSRRMELLRRYGMAKDEQIRRGAIARFTKYLSDHLGITWLGDKLGKAVSATEMGAKAGGLLALQRNGEFTDAEKQWHVVRHIGSPDFAQRGTATPIWNTVFIFSNAAIQGWNRTLEMAKANPKGFATRFMATTGMAVFIQWALESGALLEAVKGVMGDDDDETKGLVGLLEWMQKMYGKITHHNRYNYMCLPIAETDDGYCLAFRMPFAENSKLPAMMLHAALDEAYTKIKKDENFKTETGKAIANQAPNLNPVLGMSGDAFLMYVCGVNGYDKYRQRRAVRTKDWEAGGWRRFKGTTAYMIHEYTPFAIVNNMFDLRDNPYWWWNLIGALGPGAWFKFQQYGEAEQSRAVTAEKRRKKLNGKASAFYR